MKTAGKWRGSAFLAIISILAAFLGTGVQASTVWPAVGEIRCDSYIVIDQNTGRVLLEKNPDKRINPASLTKILTAVVALENIGLDKTITVSKTAASLSDGESKIDLLAGETLSFHELLYGLMLASGNDAAVAIAESVSGDTSVFTGKMNQKSRDIGAMSSSWNNPQGVTSPNHYSTSRDLAAIAKYALDNDVFCRIVNTPVYSMVPTNKHPYSGWNVLENSNKLMRYQETYYASDFLYSISGVKTGTTDAAGSNLVSTAHGKNGVELICVINGVRDPYTKNLWSYSRTLLEEGAKITTGLQSVLTENSPVTGAAGSTKTDSSQGAALYPAESLSLYIGNDAQKNVQTQIGTGFVSVMLDGKMIYKTSLVAQNSRSGQSIASGPVSGVISNQGASSDSTNKNNLFQNYKFTIIAAIVVVMGCLVIYLYKIIFMDRSNKLKKKKAKRIVRKRY